jgi:hypothetical protein
LRIGTRAKPAERERIDLTLTSARTRISDDAFAHAWNEGRTASLDRLLGVALVPRA